MEWTIKLSVLILFMSTSYINVCCKGFVNSDFDLSLEERVKSHGYPIEAYQVETEDDYLITVYNIPHGLQKDKYENKNKSIVVFMHGMGGSPPNFIIMGKERSPAYYFADRGMDVWLFSARGQVGSFKKRHKTLDWNKDRQFWLHSLHEIGKYDLSATIDFILNMTGQKQVSLIGHSAGGNEFFCLFSEKPEYTKKVKLAISWGSSPIIKRIDYPLILLGVELVDIIKAAFEYLGLVELPFYDAARAALKTICSDPETYMVCVKGSWAVGSHKSFIQRPEVVRAIVSNYARLASRQVFHFMDNVKNGDFRKYNYGPKENMKLYGQKQPPRYNLSAATSPVAFFSAPNDDEIVLSDVYEAIENLPNAVFLYKVPYSKFTHLDYITGYNASELVYEPTYRMINDIDNGIIPPRVKVPPNYDD